MEHLTIKSDSDMFGVQHFHLKESMIPINLRCLSLSVAFGMIYMDPLTMASGRTGLRRLRLYRFDPFFCVQ
jgi:hypothetical protein